jgi:hypothetical protein
VHGTYAKTANQRLSYYRWCWLLPKSRPVPKKGPKKPTRFFLLLSSKAIKKISLVFLGPFWGQGVKCQNAVFWHSESPQTHNTRTATHCRHYIAQCFSLGVRWRRLGKVACCSEKPGWAHDTAKMEVSGGNGTWDAAGGHFSGTSPPRVARSYPPFVTQRNLLNQATRKSQYVPKRKAYLPRLPCCALDEGFKGP